MGGKCHEYHHNFELLSEELYQRRCHVFRPSDQELPCPWKHLGTRLPSTTIPVLFLVSARPTVPEITVAVTWNPTTNANALPVP